MTYTAELKRIKKVLFAAAGQSTSADSGDRTTEDNRRNNNNNADDNSSDDTKGKPSHSAHKSADSAATNPNDKS